MDEEGIIEEEGEPIDPGDSSETSPVDEEPVPDVEDDGDRPDVDWGEDGVEGDADNQQTFTSQPVPPYRAGDLWIQSGVTKVCIVGKTAQQQFSADDWAPAEADEYAPTSTTRTVTLREVITDFSAESLAAYQASGAVAYALYDDGTRAQVAWSAVHEPQPTAPQVIANEALAIAEATNQHFWQRSSDPDQDGAGTGAFVTDEEQEAFLQAIAQDVQPTAQRPLHNLLMNAEGILLRAAKKIRAAFTPTGMVVYDGQGNEAGNIVASFTGSGATIGKTADSHVALDYHSMQLVDRDGNTLFDVSDQRGADGTFSVSETFRGSDYDSTEGFHLQYSVVSITSVKRNGTTVSPSSYYLNNDNIIFTAFTPASNDIFVIAYTSDDDWASSLTFGTRNSGTVGRLSASFGRANIVGGSCTFAAGDACHAEGWSSVALGSDAQATGMYSHAQNWKTIAAGNSQTAIGKFNVSDTTSALIIGNGSYNARSNAFTVDWSGNEWLAGGLTLGSPLTIANGGTGATSATNARSNLLAVGYATGMNAAISNFIGANQLFGLSVTCINANNALNGKSLSIIFRNDGLTGWNISDSSQLWSVQLPTGTISFNNAFTSTVAKVITAASGFTVSQASYVQNGRMGQWYMTVKTTNAMSANTQYTIGTIVSGKRPATWSPVTFGETSNAYGNGRMVAGGGVLVRPSASIAAGSTFYLLCPAYILG